MGQINAFDLTTKDNRTLAIRTILPNDAETFLEFLKNISKETCNTLQYPGMVYPSLDSIRERFETSLKSNRSINVGAFDGELLVGNISLRSINSGHPWIKHIGQFSMAILEKYWGKGIGKQLLQIQEEFAKSIGITKIEASVRVNNERGKKLYFRNGYIIEGTRKKSAYIDGEFLDEYFIAKDLSDTNLFWRPKTLETSRLIIRPIELEDAQNIFEYAKNPNVSKYTMWENHKTIDDSIGYIKDYIHYNYQRKIPEPLGITLKSNPDKVIGTIGFFWVASQYKSMELAYAIGEEHWGQGLVAEAALKVVQYCRDEFAPQRIQARCKSENTASAKVMEKIGMKYEGTLKSSTYHRGKCWDMHYYAF